MGLTGDDDLHVKVSPNGTTWAEAVTTDRTNARTKLAGLAIGAAPGASAARIHIDNTGNSGADGLLVESGAGGKATLNVRTTADTVNPVIAFQDCSPGQQRIGAFNFLDAAGGVTGQMAFFFNGASPAAQRMRFLVNGQEVFAAFGSGNVGIGTTASTAKLHVEGPIRCASYIVATLPSPATTGAGAMVFVTNEAGGPVMAFCDGSAWRRVTDRATVS